MNVKTRTKKALYKCLGSFPRQLPIGRTDFDKFCEKLFWTYDIPNLDSYCQAVATMIMHLSPTTDRAPLKYFAKSIKKAQANEVAYHVIQEIKGKDKEKQVEAKA
jgi:hypothetical protein